MKAKTIRKTLKKKLDSWIETIDDPELVKLVRRDTIVTGGCICSMLLGEQVNDYDIYFSTIETTEKVAQYYVGLFIKEKKNSDYTIEVRRENLTNIKKIQEERISIFVESSGMVEQESEENLDIAETNVSEKDTKYQPVFITENAITLSGKIQVVIRFYGDPEKIHENYDFEHCRCWYSYKANHLELPAKALECMLSKTLIYVGSLYPIATLFRIRKFINRGWSVSAAQMLKIAWQISELDLTNISILKDQLTGVDVAYMRQLITIIQAEKPPNENGECELDATWIATVLDRLFES